MVSIPESFQDVGNQAVGFVRSNPIITGGLLSATALGVGAGALAISRSRKRKRKRKVRYGRNKKTYYKKRYRRKRYKWTKCPSRRRRYRRIKHSGRSTKGKTQIVSFTTKSGKRVRFKVCKRR